MFRTSLLNEHFKYYPSSGIEPLIAIVILPEDITFNSDNVFNPKIIEIFFVKICVLVLERGNHVTLLMLVTTLICFRVIIFDLLNGETFMYCFLMILGENFIGESA